MALRGFIFCISLSALGYEILLIKILNITQLSFLVTSVIAMALLGYAISGSFLSLIKNKIRNDFTFLTTNSLLFAICAPSMLTMSNQIPLNPLELFWDPYQTIYLMTTYLLLALPFFFAANCIGHCYFCFKNQINIIYLFDLTGSAIGSITILLLLEYLSPSQALYVISLIGTSAAFLISTTQIFKQKKVLIIIIIINLVYLLFQIIQKHNSYSLSPYKALSQSLNIPQRKIEFSYHSPIQTLDIVSEGKIPFRMANGLSLKYKGQIAKQHALFKNGDNPEPLFMQDLDSNFIHALPNALPYVIKKRFKVISLGATCITAQLTRVFETPNVEAIVLTPQEQKIFDDLRWNCHHRNIRYIKTPPRNYFPKSLSEYDLIEIPIETSNNAIYNNLYTTEAISQYWHKLTRNGLLTIHQEIDIPPKRSIKLFNTIIQALKKNKIESPESHLVFIRSFNTTTIILKKNKFLKDEIEIIRSFCNTNSFDLVYIPGINDSEVNRYNKVSDPTYYQLVKALLMPNNQTTIDNYEFNIEPSSDDRPIFNNFFRWNTFWKALKLKSVGGLPLISWEYPLEIASLILSTFLGILFIILPILNTGSGKFRNTINTSVYFFAIGAGFMFIEIAFINKVSLYLGDPIYSVSICLGTMLCCAGIGGRYSKYLSQKNYLQSMAIMTVLLAIVYFVLPDIIDLTLHKDFHARILFTIILLAPISTLMGIPFSYGLLKIANQSPTFIPWAWGLNGLAMVMGSISSSILTLHLGIQNCILVGCIFYTTAIISSLKR